MDIQDYVNTSPPTSTLLQLDSCLVEIDMPSPIDLFRLQSRQILTYGTAERISEMPPLGGLLMLGLVSTAEGYFRSILSACLEICPISRKVAADKNISLGGVLWHGRSEFRRSAFEHMSFTSAKELKSASTGYLKFELNGATFGKLLDDYDVICNVRHGLVHNSGVLPGKNAAQIDVRTFTKSVRIDIDFAYLQSAGAVVDSLVTTFNRSLFKKMCERWATSWRERADWEPALENDRFQHVWNAFTCEEELRNRDDRDSINAASCIAVIKEEYAL